MNKVRINVVSHDRDWRTIVEVCYSRNDITHFEIVDYTERDSGAIFEFCKNIIKNTANDLLYDSSVSIDGMLKITYIPGTRIYQLGMTCGVRSLNTRLRTSDIRCGIPVSGEFVEQDPYPVSFAESIINELEARNWYATEGHTQAEPIRYNPNWSASLQGDWEASFSPRLTWTHGTVVSTNITTGQETEESIRAEELLLSYLTQDQKEQYEQNKSFIAYGSETGTAYRINKKLQINVEILDGLLKPTGKKLCAVPNESVPLQDHMLAQKLMIETNEDKFLTVAKKWGSEHGSNHTFSVIDSIDTATLNYGEWTLTTI